MQNVVDCVILCAIVVVLFLGLSRLEDRNPDWQEGSVLRTYTEHKPAEQRCVAGRLGAFRYTTKPHDEHYVVVRQQCMTRRELPNGYTETRWTHDRTVRVTPEVFAALEPGQIVRLRSRHMLIVTAADITTEEE